MRNVNKALGIREGVIPSQGYLINNLGHVLWGEVHQILEVRLATTLTNQVYLRIMFSLAEKVFPYEERM